MAVRSTVVLNNTIFAAPACKVVGTAGGGGPDEVVGPPLDELVSLVVVEPVVEPWFGPAGGVVVPLVVPWFGPAGGVVVPPTMIGWPFGPSVP